MSKLTYDKSKGKVPLSDLFYKDKFRLQNIIYKKLECVADRIFKCIKIKNQEVVLIPANCLVTRERG